MSSWLKSDTDTVTVFLSFPPRDNFGEKEISRVSDRPRTRVFFVMKFNLILQYSYDETNIYFMIVQNLFKRFGVKNSGCIYFNCYGKCEWIWRFDDFWPTKSNEKKNEKKNEIRMNSKAKSSFELSTHCCIILL